MDVILDVDTGVDDALALLLACTLPDVTVRAVTCVAGNVPLDTVVHNTLAVLDHAGAPADLPVAAGFDRALVQPFEGAGQVHGASGLAGVELPPSRTRRLVDGHAVDILRGVLSEVSAPVTLIPLAPLTNIAVLIRMAPALVRQKVERIVLMGGAVGSGNITAAAEFNAYADPEAAAVVFGSGMPVTMYGWDVFERVTIGPDDVARLAASDLSAAALAGRLLTAYGASRGGAPRIGDGGAVCAAADPGGVTTRSYPVFVETSGRTRGQTVVDERLPSLRVLEGDTVTLPPVADVCVDVDAERYARLYVDTLLTARA